MVQLCRQPSQHLREAGAAPTWKQPAQSPLQTQGLRLRGSLPSEGIAFKARSEAPGGPPRPPEGPRMARGGPFLQPLLDPGKGQCLGLSLLGRRSPGESAGTPRGGDSLLEGNQILEMLEHTRAVTERERKAFGALPLAVLQDGASDPAPRLPRAGTPLCTNLTHTTFIPASPTLPRESETDLSLLSGWAGHTCSSDSD